MASAFVRTGHRLALITSRQNLGVSTRPPSTPTDVDTLPRFQCRNFSKAQVDKVIVKVQLAEGLRTVPNITSRSGRMFGGVCTKVTDCPSKPYRRKIWSNGTADAQLPSRWTGSRTPAEATFDPGRGGRRTRRDRPGRRHNAAAAATADEFTSHRSIPLTPPTCTVFLNRATEIGMPRAIRPSR